MRILLVDDDTGVIQALLAILKSVPDSEMRVGTSGERALENAAALGGVDLLITDVVMEPMDGFTLRDEVQRRYPGVRTILISGYDLTEYAEQTRNDQVLGKPIDAETLLAAIEREFAAPPEPVAPAPVAVQVAVPVAAPVAVSAGVRAAQPAARPTARPVAAPQSGARPVVPARPVGAPAPVARPVAQSPHPVSPTARPVRAGAPGPVGRAAVVAARVGPTAPRAAAVVHPAIPAAPSEAPVEVPQQIPAPAEAEYVEMPAEPLPAGDVAKVDLIGQTLGAYQILNKLAEGRWGTVYAAVQTAINRPVALKVLDSLHAHDAAARTRFIADARAKAHVQHPSTLAVYEAGEAAGHIFYAHEYVEGQTMGQIKAGGQKLDEATALKILRTAAEGLAYLVSHNIPHSAPDGGSIYLSTDGSPRLANLAEQLADHQLPVDEEIQTLGRAILGVLPALPSLSPSMQDIVKRMVQKGPKSFVGWGQLLQAIKALEPKIVPLEAARISAQDRAAVAAVEQLRQQQKRSLFINLAVFIILFLIVVGLGVYGYKKLIGNERALDDQVHIKAGEFPFGPNAEPVTLDEFWIDKYEVTYGQYAKFLAFLKKHPERATEFDDPRQPRFKVQSDHTPKDWEIYYGRAVAGQPVHSVAIDLNTPVMQVDWWDAAAYAKWKGRELPTEQEWEKAARGTKGFIYPWGDEPDPKKANSNADHKASDPAAPGRVDGFNFWSPVDKIKTDKSPFGVMGMAGNVSEWIATWEPVKKRPLIKGGSFTSADLRLDRSSDLDPASASEAIGFRTISRTPPVKK